jgi:cell wall-associated NlpC family hydrolase
MSNFASYIGIPWKEGAQGPDAYDCMGFFRHIQKQQFGIDVPLVIAPDYEDGQALASLMTNHSERQKWVRIEKPIHGCAVLIRKPMHIGVWLELDDGGVLHCARGAGVIFTSDKSWRFSGFGRKEYFQRFL